MSKFKLPGIVVILLIVAVMAGYEFSSKPVATSGEVVSAGQAKIGGGFTLTSQTGETVSDTQFRGKHMLVYFGFTHCPMVCPTDLTNITQAMEQLSEEELAAVVPVFITVDPERDTPERLQSHFENFHPSFVALTGEKEALEQTYSAYKVYHNKVEVEDAEDGYSMDHSAFIYLMGPDGNYLTHFPHATPPEELAAGIRKHLNTDA